MTITSIAKRLIPFAVVGCFFFDSTTLDVHRFLADTGMIEAKKSNVVEKYSQANIEATAPYLEVFHPRLLVWTEDEDFRVYNLDHNSSSVQFKPHCGRCAKIVPLLVHALRSQFPKRFQTGQPAFQLLWSDADSFQSRCVHKEAGCHVDKFAPLPVFGSVPKDDSVLPTVKAFPNWFYVNCLYEWKLGDGNVKECWEEIVNADVDWNDLIPKVIWRGSDFHFLPHFKSYISPKRMKDFLVGSGDGQINSHAILMNLFHHWEELLPRWKAVLLSAQAELNHQSWMDAKFVGSTREKVHKQYVSLGIPVAADSPLTPSEMSQYKYQIDLGGGGGTSWRGTISKLAMPGVLFHHETQTKDWFYDMMKPFKHYVPVNLELTDLKGKFDWAEASQDRIKEISSEGKVLASYLLSEEYMTKLYDELFLDFLGKVVNNYVVTSPTWKENLDQYRDHGFKLTEVAYCRATKCFVNVRDGAFKSFPHVSKALPPQVKGVDTESSNAKNNENKNNLRPLASTGDSLDPSNTNSLVSVGATDMMREETKKRLVEEDDDDAIDKDTLPERESVTRSHEDRSFSIVDTTESAREDDLEFSNSNAQKKLQSVRTSKANPNNVIQISSNSKTDKLPQHYMNLLMHQDEDVDEISVENNNDQTSSYLRQRRDAEVMPGIVAGAQATLPPITGSTTSGIQATISPIVNTVSTSGMQATTPPIVIASSNIAMQATTPPIVIASSASSMQATMPPIVTGGIESISTQGVIQQSSSLQSGLNNPLVQSTTVAATPVIPSGTTSFQNGQHEQIVAQQGNSAVTTINANPQMNTTPLLQSPPKVQQGGQMQSNSGQTLTVPNQFQRSADISISSDGISSSDKSASTGKPQLISDPMMKDQATMKNQMQAQDTSGGTSKSDHADDVKAPPKDISTKTSQSNSHSVSSMQTTSDSGHEKNGHTETTTIHDVSLDSTPTKGTSAKSASSVKTISSTKQDSKAEMPESNSSTSKKNQSPDDDQKDPDDERQNPILESVRDFAKTIRGD